MSKSGHDFRPDDRQVSRLIEASAIDQMLSVLCLTATAKLAVARKIRDHFQSRPGGGLADQGVAERGPAHRWGCGFPQTVHPAVPYQTSGSEPGQDQNLPNPSRATRHTDEVKSEKASSIREPARQYDVIDANTEQSGAQDRQNGNNSSRQGNEPTDRHLSYVSSSTRK